MYVYIFRLSEWEEVFAFTQFIWLYDAASHFQVHTFHLLKIPEKIFLDPDSLEIKVPSCQVWLIFLNLLFPFYSYFQKGKK